MKTRSVVAAALMLIAAVLFVQADETQVLARKLSDEKDHAAAALEYRRMAHAAEEAAIQAAFHWAAAWEYLRNEEPERAVSMLDKAEALDASISIPALLLRGETALGDRRYDEAAFYWEGFRDSATDPDAQRYATRKLAAALVAANNPGQARSVLKAGDAGNDTGLRAIDVFRRGHDKSPLVGGLLGIIPGLGYVYAGEYANAFRCLLLNGIFIAGMVYTADEEQWGTFAVISFFEITWFSGSIYGGADAAYRYNKERREACMDAVSGGARFNPDLSALPIVQLKFQF